MNYRSGLGLSVFWFILLLSGCGVAEEEDKKDPTSTSFYTPILTVSHEFVASATTLKLDQLEKSLRAIDQMSMVQIQSGSFLMGSTDTQITDAIMMCNQFYSPCNRWFYEREGPQHPVALDAYWIDQTEVSNAQYRLCVESGNCETPGPCKKGTSTYDDPGKAEYPVACVGWDDALAYCTWIGARLPSEAEWEYAFRGPSNSIYPWGDEFDGNSLNYCDLNCEQSHADERFDDGFIYTASVGSYPSGVSWAGIYNMGGNVSEWVNDWFGDYSPESVINPTGPEEGMEKIIKGCSWYFNPAYCRGAFRASASPETRFDYLGFRCASSTASDSN